METSSIFPYTIYRHIDRVTDKNDDRRHGVTPLKIL